MPYDREYTLSETRSFDWLSNVPGDGYIVQVFVLVVKVPGGNEQIHIQTAYAEDYARTNGDDIIL